jgi:diguanylate cyclase (GGDEF)-like protein
MMRSRTPTIRSRLALLVVACVIPASLLAIALIAYDYQREQEGLVRDSLGTARALVQVIDRELSSAALAAEILGTSPLLQTGDLRGFYAQAQSAVRVQIGSNVVLSDVTGQQLINTLKPFGDPLPRRANLDQLERAFATGRSAISDVYTGAVLNRPIISIEVPVFREGKVVYDLSVVIMPERFAKALVDQRLAPDWIATVFDSTGTIVARTHDMARFAGKKGAPALIKRMAETGEDALETTSLEGISLLSIFSRSTVSNWTVAIGIPTKELTGRLTQILWPLILGLIVVLLISLAAALAIGSRIARAVHGLSDPALTLGFGGEVRVPALHLKEADEVGRALVKASKMLQEAQHRAYHDPLTGLANRVLFDELVEQQLTICRRTESPLALLYIDLDGFKAVNDRHGHATGDELLRVVTARLKAALRPSDVVARLGGDEFGVLLINTGMEGALTVVRKLGDSFSIHYTVGPLAIEISASIGIAVYPDSGTNSAELLHRADEAMYESKSDRRRQMRSG